MTLALFVIGFLGMIGCLIWLVVNAIRRKPKKPSVIGLMACAALFIAGVSINGPDSNNEAPTANADVEARQEKPTEKPEQTPKVEKLTKQETAILNKSFVDLTDEDKVFLEDIASKEENLSAEEKKLYEDNIRRLSDEEWQKHVQENTKELVAGEHTVGEQIAKGKYDVIFKGSGNFVVKADDGSLLSNEIIGLGTSQYRSILTDGAGINLSGISAVFTPVKESAIPYQEFEVSPGWWIVGQDITAGRYKVTPTKGQGNFVVRNGSSSLKTNEILGSDIGVSELVVNLDNDDMITISGVSKVKFTPEK